MDWVGMTAAASALASFLVAFCTLRLARETTKMVYLQREERIHRWAPAFLLQPTITCGPGAEISFTMHNVGLGGAFDARIWVGGEYIRWASGNEEASKNPLPLLVSQGQQNWLEEWYWPPQNEASLAKNFPASKSFKVRFIPNIEELKGVIIVFYTDSLRHRYKAVCPFAIRLHGGRYHLDLPEGQVFKFESVSQSEEEKFFRKVAGEFHKEDQTDLN